VYSLSCDEFLNMKTGWTVSCYHVSSGKDYPARYVPPSDVKPETGNAALYEIQVEKEK
jgi:hypothetical protein